MDSNLANTVLANVDSAIYHIFETFIPLNSASAWTQAQEQMEAQLEIASRVVNIATTVPDLVVAAKMFWRGKDEGWPEWKRIIDCPAELLESHPWYRSANPTSSTGTTSVTANVPSAPGDPLGQSNQPGQSPFKATRNKEGQQENDLEAATQRLQIARGTSPVERGNAAARPSGSPSNLDASADEDITMEESETTIREEDEFEDERHRGRSTIRAASTVRRGNADCKSGGSRGLFPTCSPGEQVPGACSSCLNGNIKCSLSHNGGSCVQCKMRRKKCDYAGPRGRSRALSRAPARQPASPFADSPPSRRRRAPHSLGSTESPEETGPSEPRNESLTPPPAKRRRASSRGSEIKNRKVPAKTPADAAREPPRSPPNAARLPEPSKSALGPAQLGASLGTTYSAQGEPLVSRKEHEELKSQVMALKVKNDCLRSDLGDLILKMQHVSSAIIHLESNVEATRQLVLGPRNDRPEGCLRFPLDAGAGPSPATTMVPSPRSGAIEDNTGEQNSIPGIQDPNPVSEPTIKAGGLLGEGSPTNTQTLPWFTGDLKAADDISRMFEENVLDEHGIEGLAEMGRMEVQQLAQPLYSPIDVRVEELAGLHLDTQEAIAL
ncbi:hypothetical protein EV363DRAFT_1299661 [Boletus edulis]|nr:hypothetical protein EV363DRAFT_1299661 [Boletus edulis]